ncbi:uncharacterized protein [Ovis canadensis]|uniref:uncharacterized protein isoform X1 n=1 Tax=Ovis canadensis TaxID=37174 RepID=UPI0038B46BC7
MKHKIRNRGFLKTKPQEINPEYSLEGLMLKLKLQSFGQWTLRVDLLKKTLMLGKTEGRSRRGRERMRRLAGITDSRDERETQPQRPAEVRGFDFRPVEWCGSVGSCKDTPEVFWLRQGLPPLNSPENFIFWAPPLWTRASCVFQSSWRAWQANSTDHSVPERLYVRAAEAKAEACSLSRTCWLTGSLEAGAVPDTGLSSGPRCSDKRSPGGLLFKRNFFGCTMYHMGSQFLDHGLNSRPLHWKQSLNHWTARRILYQLSHQGSP